MDVIDISKEQALKLAASFIGDQWTSLNEDDITVNIVRYFLYTLAIRLY